MTTETVTYVGPYQEVELVLPGGREKVVKQGESAEVPLDVAENLVAQETWKYEGDGPPESADATDGAQELADQRGIDLDSVEGTGKDGRVTKADVEAAAAPASGGGAVDPNVSDTDASRAE